jgi:hypothetical protein
MELHDKPIPRPEWSGIDQAVEVAIDDECYWVIMRMGSNHRLIGVQRRDTSWPKYGWCFASAGHALAAVWLFDPDTHDEPLFWHKRAGQARRAPRRDEDPDYNSARCVHGSYLGEGVCARDPGFCPEFRAERKE